MSVGSIQMSSSTRNSPNCWSKVPRRVGASPSLSYTWHVNRCRSCHIGGPSVVGTSFGEDPASAGPPPAGGAALRIMSCQYLFHIKRTRISFNCGTGPRDEVRFFRIVRTSSQRLLWLWVMGYGLRVMVYGLRERFEGSTLVPITLQATVTSPFTSLQILTSRYCPSRRNTLSLHPQKSITNIRLL